jgi:hypothetical protein
LTNESKKRVFDQKKFTSQAEIYTLRAKTVKQRLFLAQGQEQKMMMTSKWQK